MRLKNTAHFIGILRGKNIELRDYDNIDDLPEGTEILIFTLNEEQEERLKMLISYFKKLSHRKHRKGFSEISNSHEYIQRQSGPDFLERIGLRRRALIGKEDGKSVRIFRKSRMRIISKSQRKVGVQKIPMLRDL